MKAISDCKILVVDDSAENRFTVECLLENTCHIHTAVDGVEALTRAREIKPDLILLDVVMPGMDGFGTCKALKSQPETAFTPVIFLTSLSASDDKLTGFAAGGVDYVTKPFDGDEIRARVQTHLKRSFYEQEQRGHIEYLSRTDTDSNTPHLFFANHTADVLLQCSANGVICRINRSWVALTGLAGGFPVGRHVWDIACLEDVEFLRASLKRAIEERKSDLHLTFRLPTIDGRCTVRGAFRICYDHSGRTSGLNGVLTEVSSSEAQNNGENHTSGREAAAAHLAYLENISHEIRTPLNLLKGGIEHLKRQNLCRESAEAFNLIENGASDISRLLQTMLGEDAETMATEVFSAPKKETINQLSLCPVLIVDDIRGNRMILARVMESLGFTDIDFAGSGEEAIEIWKKRRHRLVFLDYQMDGIDGYETCRLIRGMPGASRPTILGVSASALAENLPKALEAGFCAQIPKPVSKQLIQQTMESLGWQFPETAPAKA